MDILATELAKILDITVEKATELFPVIRSQFISYNILSSIKGGVGILIMIGITITLTVGIVLCMESQSSFYNKEDDDIKRLKKIFRVMGIPTGLLVALNIIINVLMYTLSPDFMLLKELVLK